MRAMWSAHPDVDRPYDPDDLQKTLGQVTTPEFAAEIFSRYIDGHELLDYDALLGQVGLAVRKTAAGEVWFGAPRLSFSDRGAMLTGVTLQGSPAYIAGIDRGDRIVSVDGKEVKDQKAWDRILKSYKPGEQAHVEIGRAHV